MFLKDIFIVFLCAGIVVFLFQRFRIPSVVALLVTGLIVGPHGLALIHDEHTVETLSEIGVVVLLFTVGLEFSLSKVISMAPVMAQVGLPQVLLTTGVTTLVAWPHLHAISPSIFAGLLAAMSSTAIVIKLLADRGEVGAPHGRIAIAVLLLQDLLVVLFVLMVPILAGEGKSTFELTWSVAQGLLVVGGILLAGRYLVPPLLYQIVQTRNRELFLMAIFIICVGTAAVTGSVGLSLPLGAFLAGLSLAESEYGHQTMAEVLPFRDTLSSLFFVSVGMLLDFSFVWKHFGGVGLSLAALVAIKFAVVAIPSLLSGYPLRTAFLAGLALAQVGEFSFVLADSGKKVGLLNDEDYQTFLAASVLTMGLTPFLVALGPMLVDRLERTQLFSKLAAGRLAQLTEEDEAHLEDHVIIAGYGFNGRNLAKVLKELEIPYVVLEMNPRTVKRERANGESIMFGDCGRTSVLEHLGIEHARAYVIGISDPVSVRRTIALARQLNPKLRIIVRTRYRAEIEPLSQLGANVVIAEEFETSLEVFARVLREYHLPGNTINRLITQIRQEHYDIFRAESLGRSSKSLQTVARAGVEMESCHLVAESFAVGKTLSDLRLRNITGTNVVAVDRGGETHTNPAGDLRLCDGDMIVLLGRSDEIQRGIRYLMDGDEDPAPQMVSVTA